MIFEPLAIPEVLLITPDRFGDDRGFFFELFHAEKYKEHGVSLPFVQDNVSKSARGVLRGLHFQHTQPQGKLLTVLDGAILDVAVDIRPGSPSFGHHVTAELSSQNGTQIYVPPGFAHGFVVQSEFALVSYKCTALYAPADERVLLWNDPALGIHWGVENPVLSARDQAGKSLAELFPK